MPMMSNGARSALPIDFVRNGVQMREYVKVDARAKGDPYNPTDGYVPTARVVVCTKCHTVGTLDFPRGYSAKTGDRIMQGKVIKAICATCKGEVEMRPLTDKEMKENIFWILRRYQGLYEKLVVEKKARTGSSFVSPAEVIQTVLDNCLNPDTGAPANGPEPEKPQIIVP